MNKWPAGTVRDLQSAGILRVEDGNHGESRPRSDEFCEKGVAFIRAADMVDGEISFDTASKINERARERIKKGIGKPGDTLLSHKGTVGKIALVPEDAPPFVCSPQTTFWRSCDPRQLDGRFLHVFLRSPQFRAQLASRAAETDMAPYVSLTAQRDFSVPLPPIEIQNQIVSVISALDDKIALNRRMNETLEQMAQAIFKDWFVDFGPVRRKQEGASDPIAIMGGLVQDAARADELAALFPHTLGDGLPNGWSERGLDEIAEFLNGLALQKFPAAEEEDSLPVIKIAELRNGVTAKRSGGRDLARYIDPVRRVFG